MTQPTASTAFYGRSRAPVLLIVLTTLMMGGCLLGIVAWKASAARTATLNRAETEIHNLAHSLAEHVTNTFKAVDVATAGMVDLLRYQTPIPERFNAFLRATVGSLPQLREIAILNAEGEFIYASAKELPRHNNSDRDYFHFHRDNARGEMKITGPVQSRMLGRSVIVLSKRITKQDGSFAGTLVALIDCDFFDRFYKTFRLGAQGSIGLIGSDGKMLSNSFSKEIGRDFSGSPLFKTRLKQSKTDFYKLVSPLDGITKYFGYEQSIVYGTVSTVAIPEDELLASWRSDLLGDLIVAAALICIVSFLGIILAAQFRHRAKTERTLRKSEQLYRLLTDNIADIVILLDARGNFLFISPSVQTVLGWTAEQLVGKSCFEMVHPDDAEAVRDATAQLMRTRTTQTLRFRTFHSDGRNLWVEIAFQLAARDEPDGPIEMVGVLRDVTERKAMESELTTLNERLSELARTDGLTGLANRRSLDGFLRRCFEQPGEVSVLMIDIDHFKKFNDELGHQAGDECLKRVAGTLSKAASSDNRFVARYGGEEFAVVLPGANEQRAFIVAETIRLQVKALAMGNPSAPLGLLSISIGVAGRTDAMRSEDALIAEADMALYQAKRSGRDRVIVASDGRCLFVDADLATLQPDYAEPRALSSPRILASP